MSETLRYRRIEWLRWCEMRISEVSLNVRDATDHQGALATLDHPKPGMCCGRDVISPLTYVNEEGSDPRQRRVPQAANSTRVSRSPSWHGGVPGDWDNVQRARLLGPDVGWLASGRATVRSCENGWY